MKEQEIKQVQQFGDHANSRIAELLRAMSEGITSAPAQSDDEGLGDLDDHPF